MKIRVNAPPFFNPNTDLGPQVALFGMRPRTPTSGGVIALANGDNDLYTVPAGKRALVFAGSAYNSTGGGINIFPYVKVSGTTYRLNTTLSVGATSVGTVTHNFIYEPGDIIGVTSSVGINYSLNILEFDSASPLKTARLLDTPPGLATLYTCPAGTRAYVLGTAISAAGGTLSYCGTTGTPTVDFHLVPFGGASGAGNQIGPATAVVAATRASPTFCAALTPGDFITVNSTAIGAIVFAHISEWPA